MNGVNVTNRLHKNGTCNIIVISRYTTTNITQYTVGWSIELIPPREVILFGKLSLKIYGMTYWTTY